MASRSTAAHDLTSSAHEKLSRDAGPARVALSCSKRQALIRSSRSCASDKRSAIAVADALKSALRLLPAQILRELAHVIKRTAALPAQALEVTLRFAVG
jgi:hypothetical protein